MRKRDQSGVLHSRCRPGEWADGRQLCVYLPSLLARYRSGELPAFFLPSDADSAASEGGHGLRNAGRSRLETDEPVAACLFGRFMAIACAPCKWRRCAPTRELGSRVTACVYREEYGAQNAGLQRPAIETIERTTLVCGYDILQKLARLCQRGSLFQLSSSCKTMCGCRYRGFEMARGSRSLASKI